MICNTCIYFDFKKDIDIKDIKKENGYCNILKIEKKNSDNGCIYYFRILGVLGGSL